MIRYDWIKRTQGQTDIYHQIKKQINLMFLLFIDFMRITFLFFFSWFICMSVCIHLYEALFFSFDGLIECVKILFFSFLVIFKFFFFFFAFIIHVQFFCLWFLCYFTHCCRYCCCCSCLFYCCLFANCHSQITTSMNARATIAVMPKLTKFLKSLI